MIDLTGLKVGDTVFVVHQRRRGDKEDRTSESVVEKIGTKYAYIKQYGELAPFDKKTGISVHDPNHNARQNGFGFDVYRKAEDWLLVKTTEEERARLRPRLVDSWGRPHPFSLDVVMKIHAILDAEGLD